MIARRWVLVSVTVVALVAIVVTLFPGRAEALTVSGRFTDDNGHPLENGIEAIANAGITFGCNPADKQSLLPRRHHDSGPGRCLRRQGAEPARERRRLL